MPQFSRELGKVQPAVSSSGLKPGAMTMSFRLQVLFAVELFISNTLPKQRYCLLPAGPHNLEQCVPRKTL